MHKMDEFIIRKVNDTDFEGLIELYEQVWPDSPYDKRAKATFVLKESKGYNFCAEKKGEIVGSRTSFLVNFFYGRKALKCLHIGDSCTRKDCRGKGLFGKMNKALLSDFFNSNNGELIWNVSEPASRRVYEKCGWKYIESLSSLLCLCRPFHILSKTGLKPSNLFGEVNWDLSNNALPVEEHLLSTRERLMSEKELLHTQYNEDILNWRLKTYSGIKLYTNSFGSIYYKIGVKNGLLFVLIGEIFLSDYDNGSFKKLMRLFKKDIKPDIIKAFVSVGHPLYKIYKSNGFFLNPKHKFMNHGVRVNTPEMEKICYNPYNWAVSMLDIDTF